MKVSTVIADIIQIINRSHSDLQNLAADDHSQYLKEKLSGGTAAETPEHTHQAAASCGILDHGLALTGLGDDDHTQYTLRNILTTRGDIFVRGVAVIERLGVGTASQVLIGGTQPSWGLPVDLSIPSQAQGDILIFNGTNWTRLARPAVASRLIHPSGAANPAWTSGYGISGGWEKVEEIVLTATAQDLTFSGLNLEADKAYMLCLFLKDNLGQANDTFLYVNADFTATNYYVQQTGCYGSTVFGQNINSAGLGSVAANGASLYHIIMMKINGMYPKAILDWTQNDSASLAIFKTAWQHSSATNVTSITIRGEAANAFAIGSTAILFRKV